ncbi:MAG: hypothetical protein R2813_12015 [Flavobacteriales bacterium]
MGISKRAIPVLTSALWQLSPSISSLLVSLVVIHSYGAAVWGSIVPYIVWQQIAVSLLAFGNKDYLQRKLAENATEINALFTSNFVQRTALLLVFLVGVLLIDLNGSFLLFSLMVVGRFLQQSVDIWVLKQRTFQVFLYVDIAILAAQIVLISILEREEFVLTLIAVGFALRGVLSIGFYLKQFDFSNFSILGLGDSYKYALINTLALVSTRVDLLMIMQVFKVSDAFLGIYQLLMAFLWNFRAISGYISSPYVPHFYRMSQSAKKHLANLMAYSGVVVGLLGTLCSYLVLAFVSDYYLPIETVVVSFTFIAIPFIMSTSIYRMYKYNRQMEVAAVTVFIILSSIVLFSYFKEQAAKSVFVIIAMVTGIRLVTTTFYVIRSRRLEQSLSR